MKRMMNKETDIYRKNNHNFIVYVREKMESLGIKNCDIAKLIGKNERTIFNYMNEQTIPSYDCKRKILDYIYDCSVYKKFYCMTLNEFRELLSELYTTFRKIVTQEKLAEVAGVSQSEISRYISEPVNDFSKNYYELKYIDVETQYKILKYYHQYILNVDGEIIDSYYEIGEDLEYWLYDYRNMKDVHKYLEQYVHCDKQIYDALLLQFQKNRYARRWYNFSELEYLEEYYKNAEEIFKMIFRMSRQNEKIEKSKMNLDSRKRVEIVKIAEKHINYINSDSNNKKHYLETLVFLWENKKTEEFIHFVVKWLKNSKAAECYQEMLMAGPWMGECEDWGACSGINEKFNALSVTKQRIILEYFECFQYPYMFNLETFYGENTDFILKVRGLENNVVEEIKHRLEKKAFVDFYEFISNKEMNSLITKYTEIIQIAENGYEYDIVQEVEEESYVQYERKLGKSFWEFPVLETIETMLQFSSYEWYLQMLYVICIIRGYDIMDDIMKLVEERKHV